VAELRRNIGELKSLIHSAEPALIARMETAVARAREAPPPLPPKRVAPAAPPAAAVASGPRYHPGANELANSDGVVIVPPTVAGPKTPGVRFVCVLLPRVALVAKQ
jgi:hypothetical protein